MFDCAELFCPLCGLTFTLSQLEILNPNELHEDEQYRLETAYDARVLDESQVQWLETFHMTATASNMQALSTDEVANTSPDADVFLSVQAEWRYDDYFDIRVPKLTSDSGGTTAESTYSFYPFRWLSKLRRSMVLPIHTPCIELVRRLLRESTPGYDKPATLKQFIEAIMARFHFCEHAVRPEHASRGPSRRGYLDSGGCEWDHGYFGARAFWADPWDAEPGLEWLYADPFAIPSKQLREWASSLAGDTKADGEAAASADDIKQRTESLAISSRQTSLSRSESLPPEILSSITSFLPLRSILRLGATSRAVRAALPSLDDTFWRAQTRRLFSALVWETTDETLFPSSSTDWKAVLKSLANVRHDIIKGYLGWTSAVEEGAEEYPEYRGWRSTLDDQSHVPLGIRNRMRMGMVLEAMRMDGEEDKVTAGI